MISLLAQIGFDPQIRGALVVAVGAIVLFGSVWMIMATNQGVRLSALICLAAFFGWMVIMGGFWWIRGIGFVGESVSWQVLDFNRDDISQSSVERARVLPDPADIQGLGVQVARAGLADGVEAMDEFLIDDEIFGAMAEDLTGDPDPSSMIDLSAEELADALTAEALDQFQRNETTTLSQIMSVAPDFVEQSERDGLIPDLGGWVVMTAGEAGEAQAAAGAEILESDAFDFDAQAEFRFLDAFRTGGKPRIDRNNDLNCTFCTDNLARGWLWITNSARILNPTEYAVVQLQAIDEEALIVEEGQAPRFPAVDEDAQIISVVLVRDLGNVRFPPAMVTLGSLLIFTALAYMLHLRDRATMRRVDEHEAEVS